MIERKKQGQGRPTRIFVKNFTQPPELGQDPKKSLLQPVPPQTAEKTPSEPLDSAAVLTAQKTQPAPLEMSGQDSGFFAPNKTEGNQTDLNQPESSIPPPRAPHRPLVRIAGWGWMR